MFVQMCVQKVIRVKSDLQFTHRAISCRKLSTMYLCSCPRLLSRQVQHIDRLFYWWREGMNGEEEVKVTLSGKWWGSSGRKLAERMKVKHWPAVLSHSRRLLVALGRAPTFIGQAGLPKLPNSRFTHSFLQIHPNVGVGQHSVYILTSVACSSLYFHCCLQLLLTQGFRYFIYLSKTNLKFGWFPSVVFWCRHPPQEERCPYGIVAICLWTVMKPLAGRNVCHNDPFLSHLSPTQKAPIWLYIKQKTRGCWKM